MRELAELMDMCSKHFGDGDEFACAVLDELLCKFCEIVPEQNYREAFLHYLEVSGRYVGYEGKLS